MLALTPTRRHLRALLRPPLDPARLRRPLLELLGLHGSDLALHSLRTGLTLRACAPLGLEAVDPGLLELAGLLHDLGKLLLPAELLAVPRPHTAEESARVRRHPSLGVRLLPASLREPLILDAIAHHHERWDGTGYPVGLRGRRIPLIARLLAIADSFDAMTHPRSYRPTLGPGEALAELRAHAGTQFDPGLVPGCCERLAADLTLESLPR